MPPEPVTASVLIRAEPAEVYEYFTRAEAMVQWMGQYASLDPRPGGEFTVDVNGAPVRGRYQELDPPNRLVVSWGFAGSDELPPGASTVEVRLVREAGGTRVDIVHSGLPASQVADHARGWRHFSERLAAVRDAAVPPTFPVLTVANTRQDQPVAAAGPAEFEHRLRTVPWFANLGRPSQWDRGCVRIARWDQWPGPEHPPVAAAAQAAQAIRDAAFAAVGAPAAGGLRDTFDRVHALVLERARTAVPFDDDQDAWHAPTQCVWDAAYWTALVACVLACGWPVPDDLVEAWNWYAAGHWPSGFADEPGDGPGRRLAYPRRLLVY